MRLGKRRFTVNGGQCPAGNQSPRYIDHRLPEADSALPRYRQVGSGRYDAAMEQANRTDIDEGSVQSRLFGFFHHVRILALRYARRPSKGSDRQTVWRSADHGFIATLALLMATFASGCAVFTTHQAKLDQTELRDTLMDYVDAQIMDNLIRCKNGFPIVHYDFSHIGGVVADKLPLTVGGGQTLTDSPKTFGAGGLVLAAARGASRPFTVSSTPERDNTIDVEVLPITSEKRIYAAYLEFLAAPPDEKGPHQLGTVDSVVTTTTTTATEPKPESESKPADKGKLAVTSVTKTVTGQTKDTLGHPQLTQTTTVKAPRAQQPPGSTAVTTTTRSGTADFTVDFDKIHSVCESSNPPKNPDDVLFGEKQWQHGKQRYVAKRWTDGNYYWVSKKYKASFFKLCVATVARGYATPIAAPSTPSASPSAAPSPAAPGGPAGNGRTPQQLFEDFGSILRQLQIPNH
jgi:hypothetical protein